MNISTLHTTIAIYDALGALLLTVKVEQHMEQALASAEVWLDIMPSAERVRVSEDLPWGEEIAETVYRGPLGPEFQLEMPHGRH